MDTFGAEKGVLISGANVGTAKNVSRLLRRPHFTRPNFEMYVHTASFSSNTIGLYTFQS